MNKCSVCKNSCTCNMRQTRSKHRILNKEIQEDAIDENNSEDDISEASISVSNISECSDESDDSHDHSSSEDVDSSDEQKDISESKFEQQKENSSLYSQSIAPNSLSPALIQAYLSSKGVNITLAHASQLSASLTGNNNNQTTLNVQPSIKQKIEGRKKSSSKDQPHIFTTRNAQIDPKFLTKEAKQMEALQAQALGGMGYHSQSFQWNKRVGSTEENCETSGKENETSLKPGISSTPSASNPLFSPGNNNNEDSNTAEECIEEGLNLEEIINEEFSDNCEESFSNIDERQISKWDRIPIGTFRRSRKVSRPILKLSKAVKSTFGVVHKSINETLLVESSCDNLMADYTSSDDDDVAKEKPGSRLSRLSVSDLSRIIHDPDNPPSACTSPTLFSYNNNFPLIENQDNKRWSLDDECVEYEVETPNKRQRKNSLLFYNFKIEKIIEEFQ